MPFGSFMAEENQLHTYNTDVTLVNSCGDNKVVMTSYFHSYYGSISLQSPSSNYFNDCSINEKQLINYFEP